jgi:fibronectin type 3 domain-containing protein
LGQRRCTRSRTLRTTTRTASRSATSTATAHRTSCSPITTTGSSSSAHDGAPERPRDAGASLGDAGDQRHRPPLGGADRRGPAGGYRIYRGTASGVGTLLATVGNVTTFTDLRADRGTTYFYVVSAFNGGGESGRSNELSATAWNVPGAPTLSSAQAVQGGIALAWNAPSSDGGTPVTGYQIYRTANGAGTLLATVGNVTAYTDATAAPGATYSYDVSAVNAVGEGPRSNARSATAWTVPGAPTLTTAQIVKSGVALAWDPPASNGGTPVTGYRIYRGTASGGETLLASVGNVTTYTDTTAPNGKTSYYQVGAVNVVGEGGRSNELSAKRVR